MNRYPRYESGLARPVTELGFEVVEQVRGKTNNHHLYYPRPNYQSPLKTTFRNLTDHVHPMWIVEHNILHRRYSETQIPHEQLMIEVLDEYMALNGVINCVYENKTNQLRQVTQNMYERIRDGQTSPLGGQVA